MPIADESVVFRVREYPAVCQCCIEFLPPFGVFAVGILAHESALKGGERLALPEFTLSAS